MWFAQIVYLSSCAAGLCYFVDMLLSLHVGFVVTYNLQKKVVMNGRQIARFYWTGGRAALDLLSVIPWLAQASVLQAVLLHHNSSCMCNVLMTLAATSAVHILVDNLC